MEIDRRRDTREGQLPTNHWGGCYDLLELQGLHHLFSLKDTNALTGLRSLFMSKSIMYGQRLRGMVQRFRGDSNWYVSANTRPFEVVSEFLLQ